MGDCPAERQDFNPRSRKGSDAGISYPRIYGHAISIHAPARGATLPIKVASFGIEISIHAPARGATIWSFWLTWAGKDFNPRSRKGSDDG